MITLESIKTVNIELNNICNLSCTLCQRNNPEMDYYLKQKNHLDYDALLKILDKFKNLKNVYLFGNLSEPVLYYNFLNLIKELKKRNLNLTISTNGNPYSETFWKDFGNSLDSNDTCIFAIDGSTQEKYQQYRINGKLSKVIENYRVFAENTKAKKVIQTIKFPWLDNDLNKEFEELQRLINKDQINLSTYTFTKKPLKNHSIDEIRTKEDQALNRFYDKIIKKNKTIEKPPIDCFSKLENNIYINYLGDIIPCCYIHEELLLTRDETIPNLYEKDLESKFNLFFKDWYENKIYKNDSCIETCSNKLKYFRK